MDFKNYDDVQKIVKTTLCVKIIIYLNNKIFIMKLFFEKKLIFFLLYLNKNVLCKKTKTQPTKDTSKINTFTQRKIWYLLPYFNNLENFSITIQIYKSILKILNNNHGVTTLIMEYIANYLYTKNQFMNLLWITETINFLNDIYISNRININFLVQELREFNRCQKQEAQQYSCIPRSLCQHNPDLLIKLILVLNSLKNLFTEDEPKLIEVFHTCNSRYRYRNTSTSAKLEFELFSEYMESILSLSKIEIILE